MFVYVRHVASLALPSMFLALAVAQTTTPAEGPPAKEPSLYRPYSLMESLDLDTKLKIDVRHDETLAAIKALREQERNDIMAMLTEEQRTELGEVEAKLDAERQEYIRERQRRLLEERQAEDAESEDAGE